MENLFLGIDVGASGIKGALVNVQTGEMEGARFRVDMPQPSTPENAAAAIAGIVQHFKYTGKTIPGQGAYTKLQLRKCYYNCRDGGGSYDRIYS